MCSRESHLMYGKAYRLLGRNCKKKKIYCFNKQQSILEKGKGSWRQALDKC